MKNARHDPITRANGCRPDCEATWRLRATRSVLAEREKELLNLRGPCSTQECCLHHAHNGPCDIDTGSTA